MLKAQIIQRLIEVVMTLVVQFLTEDNLRKFADRLLDLIEDIATDSTNKVDDKIVLSLCQKIRDTFDVPDNDLI